MNQEAKLCAKRLLNLRGYLLVGGRVQTTARDFGGEPVSLAEADGERNKVLFDLLSGEILTDLVERLDSLRLRSARGES